MPPETAGAAGGGSTGSRGRSGGVAAHSLRPLRPQGGLARRRTVCCRDAAAESVKPARPTTTGG